MSFSESPDDNPLQCPLCMVQYDTKKHEAKLLTCHHSFCLTCVHQTADGRSAIKCPTCRKKTPVPTRGVRALQTNFYISQMREVMSMPKGRTSSSGEEVVDVCAKHSGQPLLFFCETCSEPICMNCTVLDHEKSGGHAITDIAKVIASFKEVLTSKATNIGGALERRRTKLQALKTELGCLDIARDVAQDRIQETINQLKAKLDQRQQKLMDKLNNLHQERKNEIIKQAQLLKSETKALNDTLEHVQNLSSDGKTSAVVTAAVNAKSIAELDNLCLNIDMGAPIVGHIQFKYEKGLKNFIDAVNHLGEVNTYQNLPAVVSLQVQSATAGHMTSVQVTVRDGQNEAMSTKDLSMVIVDPEGLKIKAEARAGKQDVLLAQFRPQISGEHQAVIQFLDRPLSAATKAFAVESNNPVQVIGEPGTGNGQLNRPTSVVVSPKGHIYVADMGNKRVQIFTPAGKPLTQFKIGSTKTTTYDLSINKKSSEILCTKVAPDPASGHMVADTVRVFDLSGEKKHQYALRSTTNALFLAVTAQGGVAVTDSASHCVRLYNADFQPSVTFGSFGADPGFFNFPSAIAVGEREEIFVSDTRNHRVQVFDAAGNYLRQFGSEGKGRGHFRSPRGLVADGKGHVLVADSCNRVQVFSVDGTYLSTIESETDPINEPYNMDTTPDGHVYLADFKSCCVKKYKYI